MADWPPRRGSSHNTLTETTARYGGFFVAVDNYRSSGCFDLLNVTFDRTQTSCLTPHIAPEQPTDRPGD